MNGEPQHLLIVDDDRRIRELIKVFAILRQSKYANV